MTVTKEGSGKGVCSITERKTYLRSVDLEALVVTVVTGEGLFAIGERYPAMSTGENVGCPGLCPKAARIAPCLAATPYLLPLHIIQKKCLNQRQFNNLCFPVRCSKGTFLMITYRVKPIQTLLKVETRLKLFLCT